MKTNGSLRPVGGFALLPILGIGLLLLGFAAGCGSHETATAPTSIQSTLAAQNTPAERAANSAAHQAQMQRIAWIQSHGPVKPAYAGNTQAK